MAPQRDPASGEPLAPDPAEAGGKPGRRVDGRDPVAVLLAAGASTRMGRPKLLLPWGAGTVLDATLAALRDGGVPRVVVVVAPGGPLAGWEPPLGVRVVVNPDPARGMLSTVLAGMAAAGPADPLVVCPADLPGLRASTVAALLAVYFRDGGVVVPRHGGKRGHPLLLAPAWSARVPAMVSAERGLRQILELAAGAVREVAVDDPGCVEDVDTPEAYAARRPR